MARDVTLYDHRGQPVSKQALRKEQAGASVFGVRNPYAESVIFGMTPQRLAAILQAASQGDHEQYLSLAQEMERRDGHYSSQLQVRKLATTQLDRMVRPPTMDESAEMERRCAELNTVIQSSEFGLIMPRIMEAIGKGFSAIEIMWDTSEAQWNPCDFKWRDERWFKYDQVTATELRLRDGSADGVKLAPYKYIVHEPNVMSGLPLGGGLARIVAALHLFKSIAVKDWMAFAEVCGMPIRIGKYPAGATEEQIHDLEVAVSSIGNDAAAVISNTMVIEFERASQSGARGSDQLYMDLANWLDKQISKTVLGTNNVDEKGSYAKAESLDKIRIAFRNDDAIQLCDTLNKYIVKPWYDLNYGVPPSRYGYPYIWLDTSEAEDLEAFSRALVPLIDRGLSVKQDEVREKFSLSLPAENDLVLGPLKVAEPVDKKKEKDKDDADRNAD